jgi:hypothetical protein
MPASARVDPVTAAFEAGGRAARRQVQTWRIASAAMLLIAIGGWLMPFAQTPSRIASPTIATVTPTRAISPSPSPVNLVALERSVREKGIDALPRIEFPAAASLRTSDLF